LALFGPELAVRSWRGRPEFARMHVPKAPIHEYDLTATRENEVRGSGQSSHVKPVAVAEGMEPLPHTHFRFGVRTSYVRHVPTPLLRSEDVDHENRIRVGFRTVPRLRTFSAYIHSAYIPPNWGPLSRWLCRVLPLGSELPRPSGICLQKVGGTF
jgi:hypothetical protein